MIVVSDTSPITNLAAIAPLHLRRDLYGEVETMALVLEIGGGLVLRSMQIAQEEWETSVFSRN